MPTFKFRHTEPEMFVWQGKADDAGMTLSAWIRSQPNRAVPTNVPTAPKPVPTPKRSKATTHQSYRPRAHAPNCPCLSCRAK